MNIKSMLCVLSLLVCACRGLDLDYLDASVAKYPTAWVQCSLTGMMPESGDAGDAAVTNEAVTYYYTCHWSQSDCTGGIGDPTICLSSETPCPEDYGYCAMAGDRTFVNCTGFVGGPEPPLTKPGTCRT